MLWLSSLKNSREAKEIDFYMQKWMVTCRKKSLIPDFSTGKWLAFSFRDKGIKPY